MSLEPGTTFGRFEVLEQIGSGGMGAVYRARDPRLGRHVALKVLHAQDERARADILHEARAAARIEHPNAVLVFDADEVDGVPYIAMEMIEGTSLRAMIGREGISIETKVTWLLGIARALAAAHAKGVVHRDLKPENVMIREDGIVKVLDFGIAARMPEVDRSAETGTLEEAATDGGKSWVGGTSVKGTVAYCAPEQLRGERIDGRADQFSWGVIAFELVAGVRPWAGAHAAALVDSILFEGTDIERLARAGAPRALCDSIERALQKAAQARFRTSGQWVDSLAPLDGDRHVLTNPSRLNDRPGSPLAAAAAGAALLMGVIAGLAGVAASTTRTSDLEPKAARPQGETAAYAIFQRGIESFREGSIKEAEQRFRDAVSADPNMGVASLRLLAIIGVGTHESRERLQAIRVTRTSLDAEDLALFASLEPAAEQSSVLGVVEKRLLVAISRMPQSAKLWFQLARTRFEAARYADAIAAFDETLRLDAGMGAAAAERARAFLYLNDLNAAKPAYAACLSAFPASTSCIVGALIYARSDGDCARAGDLARKLIALQPETPAWYDELANATYDDGRGLQAAREALSEKWAHSSAEDRDDSTLQDLASLDVLTGDLRGAREHSRAWEAVRATLHDAWPHTKVAIMRINIALESGSQAEASSLSYEYLRKLPAWSGDESEYCKIYLIRGLYWSGAISRDAFVAQRETWVLNDARVQAREGTRYGMSWLQAYAQPVLVAADAVDALQALARYPNVPNRVNRGNHNESDIGEIYRLLGDTSRALESLETAAASCEAISFPLEYGWANLRLGKAREAAKDLAGACVAYGKVLAIWGKATPASVSAAFAFKRSAALDCPRR